MTNPLHTVFKNTGYLIGARGMTMIVRATYAIALARYLGPEQYGLYNYALGWYLAFMPFTSLGLWAVISRDAGKSKQKGRQTVSETLALRSILSLVTSIACGVSGWLMHEDITTQQLLLVFSVAMLGRAMANWVEHIFNAYSSSKYVFKLEAVFRPIEAILSVAILTLGGELLHLAMIHGIIWWIQGLKGMSILHRRLFHVSPQWHLAGIKRLLRKGFLLGISSFLIIWFLQGPLLLSRQIGFSLFQIGQLALLLQIFTILSQFPNMLGAAALPILSQTNRQGNNSDQKILEISLKISWLVGSIAGLTGWFMGPFLIDWMFGNKFLMVGNYLGIVLYLLIPWSWGNLLWIRMLSKGLLRKTTFALLIGGVSLTLIFFLTKHWGIIGIFISLLSSLSLWVFTIYFMQKTPKRILINSLFITFTTLGIMLFIDNSALAFTIGILITLLGFWLDLASHNERQTIKNILNRH